MTTLLEQIKQRTLELRKEIVGSTHDITFVEIERDTLITLVAEATMIGKNDGNRDTTDAETVAMIKKFITNIDATLEILNNKGGPVAKDAMISCRVERAALAKFLPAQMSNDEIRAAVSQFVTENNLAGPKGIGLTMKMLKTNFDGKYDGNAASKIVREVLGA